MNSIEKKCTISFQVYKNTLHSVNGVKEKNVSTFFVKAIELSFRIWLPFSIKLITAHTPISAQSSNFVKVFKLQVVYF